MVREVERLDQRGEIGLVDLAVDMNREILVAEIPEPGRGLDQDIGPLPACDLAGGHDLEMAAAIVVAAGSTRTGP